MYGYKNSLHNKKLDFNMSDNNQVTWHGKNNTYYIPMVHIHELFAMYQHHLEGRYYEAYTYLVVLNSSQELLMKVDCSHFVASSPCKKVNKIIASSWIGSSVNCVGLGVEGSRVPRQIEISRYPLDLMPHLRGVLLFATPGIIYIYF